MAIKKNIIKDYSKEEFILVLANTVTALTSSSGDILKASEAILRSCNAPGTKGDVNKDLILTKAHNLKKLAALYISAAKKLMGAINKLVHNVSRDEALADVLVYGQFLNDQLKCEERDAHRVLRKLNEDR
ncbi:MAG: hypothetical protein ACE5KZ_13000 [Candidatus Scalinduaceae bacterium]